MNNKDPLLSSSEAEKFLGLSKGTLAVWRTTMRYPLSYIKIGKLVKYRLSDLEQFIHSNQH